MQQLTDRPPFVTFEVRAVEDRAESLTAGHYVAKDVDYAIITPMGSKDRIERVASEWFDSLAQNVQEGRFPMEWLHRFRESFAAWKAGQAIPEHGTPIRNWSVPSPAQIRSLTDAGITTVEDLANCNEEGLMRVGMGGRSLRDRARAWLEQSIRVSAPSEQLAALELANKQLTETNDKLQKQLSELAAQVAALAPQAASRKL
jgi:hypothetical protein